MPYIGRDLNRGNYLKLDDISSSFNSSTKTFNLTVGGSAFTPGSAFSILVSVGGVIQEPESAYQVNNSQITFANAPTAQDGFFCIALGVSLGINVPGSGTVNGPQMAKPFNYDGFFYLNDANNRVGINSSIPTVALDIVGNTKISGNVNASGILTATAFSGPTVNTSGISTFYDLRVSNNLTVEGTTTTLDTNLIGVDRVEVGANSNTLAGIAVTQSGSADLVRLYDGASQVVTVDDTGNVGIGTHTPDHSLHVYKEGGDSVITIESTGNGNHSALEFMRTSSGGNSKGAGSIFVTGDTSASAAKMNFGVAYNIGHGTHSRMTIEGANGRVGIGTDSPTDILDVYSTTDPTIRSRSGSSSVGALMEICGGSSNDSTLFLSSGTTKKYQIFRDGSQSDDLRIYDTANTLDVMRYRHGGYLHFGVNGQERLRIMSDGKVGIATDQPYSNLTVYGENRSDGGSATGQITAKDNAAYNANPTSGIVFQGHFASNNANAVFGGITGLKENATDGNYAGALAFHVRNNGAVAYEALRIRSDGNVGIATANPTNKLSVVNGGIKVYGAATPNINFSPYGGNAGNGDISFDGTDLKIIANSSSANIRIGAYSKLNHIVVKANGHIGIHTDSPSNSTHLTIAGTSNYEAGIHYQQSNVSLYRFQTEGGTGHVYYDSYGINSGNDGDHVFRTKASTGAKERLRITNDGQLLHGHDASIGYGRNFETSSTSGYGGIAINRFSADTGSGGLDFVKSRNASLGGNTIVQSGDNLGAITWRGADGTDFTTPAAQIKVAVDGTVAGNQMPGAMTFHTNSGTTSATERLRIKPDGKIKFASNNSSTDYLEYGSNPRLWLRCPSNMNGLRIDASTTPLQIRTSDATGRQISVGGAPNSDISISGDYSLSSGGYDNSPRVYLNATRHNGSTSVTSFQTSIQAVATSNTNNTGYLGLGASASPDDLVIKTDGSIGINNTNPQEKLQIAGNITLGNRGDNLSRYIGKGTNGDGGVIGDASANDNSCWIGFVSGTGTGFEDQLRFGTHKSGDSGAERLRIDGAGHILIPGSQTVSDQTGMLDIYHTSPAEIDSPHIRLWGPTNQDARIEFGSESNAGEGAYISYNDSDEGLYIGSRMATYSEIHFLTAMNDGNPHLQTNSSSGYPYAKLTINNDGRSVFRTSQTFDREAHTKGGTVYGGGAASGANTYNNGMMQFQCNTPVRGTDTGYTFWVQTSDAYPNASNYIDIDVANSAMYRVLIKGSNSSDTADIAQFLIYGLANNDGQRPPVIEQVTTSPPSFNGDSGSYSPDFHRNSGSFSCIVKGFGTSGGTRGSLGTYGTTLRFQYSGNNNQGLIAHIERWY